MTLIRITIAVVFSLFYAIPAISEERITSAAEVNNPVVDVKPADGSEPAARSLKIDETKPVENIKPPAVKNHIAVVKYAETAGNYVYLQVEEDGKEQWIATMPSMLKASASPGDKVEYSNEITMKDFESKGLGKTFDTILFVTRIKVLEKEMPEDEFHKIKPRDEKTVTTPVAGEIEKAADGKTIGELFSEHDALKDKEVTIRAKVMKLKKNILKKTWLTLQDGTGSAPDDKLLATTTEEAQQGDIIVVRGILRTNVDLSEQYKYKILLEETKIVGK